MAAVAQRRTQEERRAETRRALIDATLEYLLEYGYQGASLVQIAQTAGLTTGAVQHHFRSKRELMLAVITEELFAPLDGLDPMDQVKAPLRERCRFAVDSIWIWYNNSRYPAVWDIILAARHDAELMASIQAWRAAAAKELDAAVVKLFPEFAFTPERLKNLQHFVTSHLRGVRFMRIYEDHRLEIDEQLRLLAEALRQMIEATPRK